MRRHNWTGCTCGTGNWRWDSLQSRLHHRSMPWSGEVFSLFTELKLLFTNELHVESKLGVSRATNDRGICPKRLKRNLIIMWQKRKTTWQKCGIHLLETNETGLSVADSGCCSEAEVGCWSLNVWNFDRAKQVDHLCAWFQASLAIVNVCGLKVLGEYLDTKFPALFITGKVDIPVSVVEECCSPRMRLQTWTQSVSA